MKLRLKRNSIRLRLGPNELQVLVGGGAVTESVSFGLRPEDRLIYSITISDRAELPAVTFEDRHIAVRLARDVAIEWANSDEVAIAIDQPAGEGNWLSVLIEKDFACMHGEETDTDVFPNPLQSETA